MKLGNTYFDDLEPFKKLSLSQFKKMYDGVLKGISLEDAYKKLSGNASTVKHEPESVKAKSGRGNKRAGRKKR